MLLRPRLRECAGDGRFSLPESLTISSDVGTSEEVDVAAGLRRGVDLRLKNGRRGVDLLDDRP
eukprot:1892752-Prorocentrum_lima.AAC.1